VVCRSFHGEDNASGLVSTGRIDTAEGGPSFDAAFLVGHVPDVSSRLLALSRADHGTSHRGQLQPAVERKSSLP
jgi:hypothetical protein